jgi:hypothetical protein
VKNLLEPVVQILVFIALTATDAMLFVPTADEARKLLEISPWPVTVLA